MFACLYVRTMCATHLEQIGPWPPTNQSEIESHRVYPIKEMQEEMFNFLDVMGKTHKRRRRRRYDHHHHYHFIIIIMEEKGHFARVTSEGEGTHTDWYNSREKDLEGLTAKQKMLFLMIPRSLLLPRNSPEEFMADATIGTCNVYTLLS